MNALTDQQLLRKYAESRSDSAFRELVRRHLDLVHSAALRLVRDPHTAEDVAQAVFTALAKDARKVASHPVLAGWLHRTTRHLSANVIRTDARRRARERQAIAMNEQTVSASDPEPPWADIASHLDAVLGELGESDRDAVLLRFFEKRSAKEIAAALGITAEAAQKRVNRAIERLRESFARRGVTGSGAGFTAAIGHHAVQAAPSGLAATITAGAIAGTVVTTTTTVMIVVQKMLVPAAAVALAGTWLVQNHEAKRLRAEIAPAPQATASLSASGAGFAKAGTESGDASGSAGLVAGAESSRRGAAAGGGAMVAAGVIVGGDWFGAGPGPRPVALDNLGRPTTAMVEELELTDAEVSALEAAIARIRAEAAADFVQRVKPAGSGKQDDGDHYVYHAAARSDRGQYFFDALTQAFTDAIGEDRGRSLREAMKEDDFLGGMGKYDLEFDFIRDPEGRLRVKCWYRKPGSQEDVRASETTIGSFEENFGRVFEFPEGGTPHPEVPIRWLPESR